MSHHLKQVRPHWNTSRIIGCSDEHLGAPHRRLRPRRPQWLLKVPAGLDPAEARQLIDTWRRSRRLDSIAVAPSVVIERIWR